MVNGYGLKVSAVSVILTTGRISSWNLARAPCEISRYTRNDIIAAFVLLLRCKDTTRFFCPPTKCKVLQSSLVYVVENEVNKLFLHFLAAIGSATPRDGLRHAPRCPSQTSDTTIATLAKPTQQAD